MKVWSWSLFMVDFFLLGRFLGRVLFFLFSYINSHLRPVWKRGLPVWSAPKCSRRNLQIKVSRDLILKTEMVPTKGNISKHSELNSDLVHHYFDLVVWGICCTMLQSLSTESLIATQIFREECPCFHRDSNLTNDCESHPLSALPPCSFLPTQFIQCNEPIDHQGNKTLQVSMSLPDIISQSLKDFLHSKHLISARI